MARFIFVVVLVSWYSIVGHLRAQDWTSELSLWTRAVAVAPMSPLAHINRAKALFGLGRESEALQEFYISVSLEHD